MINFSGTENISNLIEFEKIFLMSTLDIQKNFNKQLLMLNKNFMANIKFSFDVSLNDEDFSYLNDSTNLLNKSFSNIRILQKLLDLLEKIDVSSTNLDAEIRIYNDTFKQSMDFIYSNTELIEKFICQITTNGVYQFTPTSAVLAIEQSTSTETTCNQKTSSPYTENTLIISESKNKVILPYKIDEVENIFKNNTMKYNSIQDVINKLYTRPLSIYKVSAISRFKEAFKLVTERERGSKFKALGLAFELFGNYSLHPAIITACKSLDELDIYLACLDENTLDDFHFFDIKYEVPPVLSKTTKNYI